MIDVDVLPFVFFSGVCVGLVCGVELFCRYFPK